MKKLFLSCMIAVAALASGCTQIDSGNVGVSKVFGKVKSEERGEGVYMTVVESLMEFTTKEVPMAMDNMKPKSSDNLSMTDVDVDIYFKANPGRVAETVIKYQGDSVRYNDLVKDSRSSDLVVGYSRVNRAAREAIYKAFAKFPATTMHTKRTELAGEIQTVLQAELDKSDPGTWTITSVNVRNLLTDPAIEQSIRSKVETDQAIEQAVKQKELARLQAETKIAAAQGEARANEILSSSLSPMLVRVKEIEAQKAFATQGTHTVIMGGNGSALVNVGK